MAVLDAMLFVFGGFGLCTAPDCTDGSAALNDLHGYDLVQGVWTDMSPPGFKPPARQGAVAAAYEGSLYVFGGQGRQPAQRRRLSVLTCPIDMDAISFLFSMARWDDVRA